MTDRMLPLRLFDWCEADATDVKLAAAFRKRSVQKWTEISKLRDESILKDLERYGNLAKQNLGLSSSMNSSIDPASKSQTPFRLRSQQSWCQQHQKLLKEAAHIVEGRPLVRRTGSSSAASLVESLLQKGYGLEAKVHAAQTGKAALSIESSMKGDTFLLATQGTRFDFKDQLAKFYGKYNPDKLGSLDSILSTYSGRDEELFHKLHERYVPIASLQKRKIKSITKATDPTVYMDISIAGTLVGRIIIRLLKEEVPLAAESFRCLCTGGKDSMLTFKGCKFHRIIKNFIVQGGDTTNGDRTGGQSINRGTIHGDLWGNFKDDFFLLHDDVGLLSMANAGKNTNSSQFFIMMKTDLKNLDGKHVVFGEVVDGLDVVDAMQNVKVSKGTNCPMVGYEIEIVDCGEL